MIMVNYNGTDVIIYTNLSTAYAIYVYILDHFVSPLPFVSSSRLIDIEYNISGCSLLQFTFPVNPDVQMALRRRLIGWMEQ